MKIIKQVIGMKAFSKAMQKADFEIMFNDSPDYFFVKNAKMIQEGMLIRFICFDENNKFLHDEWYPVFKIHRIKRYGE